MIGNIKPIIKSLFQSAPQRRDLNVLRPLDSGAARSPQSKVCCTHSNVCRHCELDGETARRTAASQANTRNEKIVHLGLLGEEKVTEYGGQIQSDLRTYNHDVGKACEF